MSSPAYEERQRKKRLAIQYRKAAARLHNIEEQPFGEVKQMSGGAYVEIKVWVPTSEAFKEKVEP